MVGGMIKGRFRVVVHAVGAKVTKSIIIARTAARRWTANGGKIVAEFQMIAKNLERMCNTYRSSSNKCGTDKCSLYRENLCYARQMVHVRGDDAGRLEDVVMKWAEEHPEPVYPTWGEYLYALHNEPSSRELSKSIPADIAQKLGIEPK